MSDTIAKINWRRAPRPEDSSAIRRLVRSTGFFNREEIRIAGELVEERMLRGRASGYQFLFAQVGHRLFGYACFGPIAGTQCGYDLYWIAVAPRIQGRGLGRIILRKAEAICLGRRQTVRIWVETSSRPQYQPTRDFYLRYGYTVDTILADFYAPNDGKVILSRVLSQIENPSPPGHSSNI